jgi:hypothetical protein
MINIYINKIFIYIKLILSYIIEIMLSYKTTNNNYDKLETNNNYNILETNYYKIETCDNFNIYCSYCRKLILPTDKIYCIHDKTFCTMNCRASLFVKK